MNLTVHVIQPNGSGVPPINLVVDAGGIDINGNTNGGASATHTVAVTDGGSATIAVSQSGRHDYNMHIDNVYSTDREIFILLPLNITDIEDADYNRPYAMFFYFQDPCSFKTDVYNASAFAPNLNWYLNNTLLENFGNASKFTLDLCQVGDYQIKVRTQTFEVTTTGGACPQTVQTPLWDRQWANTDEPTYVIPGQILGQGETGNVIAGDVNAISAYLGLDLQTNLTVVEYRPELTLVADTAEDDLDTECCFSQEETVTITPTWSINRPGATTHTITWQVIDPETLEVELSQSVFPLDGFTSEQRQISFDLDKIGTYTVRATIEDVECGTTFTRELEVKTCDFLEFVSTSTDCGSYELQNRSTEVDVVFAVNDTENNEIVAQTTLAAGETASISLTTPGMYTVTVTFTEDDEDQIRMYVIANFCSIENCISQSILNVLCDDTKECECEYTLSSELETMRLVTLSQTYFMHLHENFSINNFYTALSDSDMANITDAQQVIEKLIKICDRMGCLSSDCGPCGVTSITKTTNRTQVGNKGCGCS